MRTSRIAQETSKVIESISVPKSTPRRQTRSFAASLSTFTPNGTTIRDARDNEDDSDVDCSLSSAPSIASSDIEDLASSPNPRKRKRVGSPTTTVTSISTSTVTRTSPRKVQIKAENEGGIKLKKARRQPSKKILNECGEVEIHAPSNWEEIYDTVKEMRKTKLAPVDTMGCETLAEEHLTPRDKRFQTLIALMLSSQTKDTTNAIAMRRLQTELPSPGLTIENILAVDSVKLNEMIYVVGFHNNKTRYIKATALILRDDYNSDIPDTIEGLMSLPGVGPKMAYLCLSAAWGRTEGIGVDVHVHRITNLWRWHKTKAPEETRAALEAWLPKERWHEINHLLVGFGQTICVPVGRKCENCKLSEKGLCPSAVVGKKEVITKVKMKKSVGRAVAELEEESIKEEDVLVQDL